jgi:RecG-like helicase
MGALRRYLDRLTESDESRLASEIERWSASIPGTTRLGQAKPRDRVKIAGTIKRLTILPIQDHETLEALVSDGTGEVVVVFMGRRGIGGLSLGTRVVIEGVLGEQRGTMRLLNPHLEFST